jgi:hypothetical protein
MQWVKFKFNSIQFKSMAVVYIESVPSTSCKFSIPQNSNYGNSLIEVSGYKEIDKKLSSQRGQIILIYDLRFTRVVTGIGALEIPTSSPFQPATWTL